MSISKFFTGNKQESLAKGLAKTKHSFWDKFNKALIGKSTIDEAVLDTLEELLIAADVGIDTTLKIIQRLEERVSRDKYVHMAEIEGILQAEISNLFCPNLEQPITTKPHVILVVGVNGVGKTTTIGKLASYYKQQGKRVILGAADTFRAAATNQLQSWGDRVGIPVIARGMHADPAAVAYDTLQAGIHQKADIVIIDTAGRLHNKIGLMHELSKLRRTLGKHIIGAPQEVLLVLDATTGQNAFAQTQAFMDATKVTALAITKLDGTAKGGVVLGISAQFQVPIKYIGIGEQITDLQVFDQEAFVATLFKQ